MDQVMSAVGEFSVEYLMLSLSGLIPFGVYFVAALLFAGLFIVLYSWMTPYCEKTLIKENNSAAALSFIGAVLGFALPLTSAMNSSDNLIDFSIWAVVAILVQIIVFNLVRIPFPKSVERIENNEASMGVVLAGISIAVGMINAAAMSY